MKRLFLLALLTAASGQVGCADDGGDLAPAPDQCEGEGFDADCEPDPAPNPEPEGDPFVIEWESFEQRPCPDDSILTYDNFGRSFMLDWCIGCHSSALPEEQRAGAPLGTDLDSIEGIRALDARIWARSGDDNLTMPPAGGSALEDRFRLAEWLACGSP